MILPGVLASGAIPAPTLVQEVLFNASGQSLPAAPSSGNVLLWLVGTGGIDLANYDDPAGFTTIVDGEVAAGSATYRLYARVSDGTEQTAPTMTFGGGTPVAERFAYQEWSGLETTLASLLDDANDIQFISASGTATSWDPAATTGDQDRLVYLCLAKGTGGLGAVVSDWADLDVTNNDSRLYLGHKIVLDGASCDTAVSWTNGRATVGAVLPLRAAA